MLEGEFTYDILPPSRSTCWMLASLVTEHADATPMQTISPFSTKTLPPASEVEKATRIPSPSFKKTLLTLVKMTRSEWDSVDARGGNPSYLRALSASWLKSGVLGTLWKDAGFGFTYGVVIWAIPSINTCLGVAPSASGWLSHNTTSKSITPLNKMSEEMTIYTYQHHNLDMSCVY